MSSMHSGGIMAAKIRITAERLPYFTIICQNFRI